ncbi:MAG TPA: non-heme iron oxygenase ferredoxin subunit [Dehalococcoidia bacterium]|nr:non-heme iron oxygenase ferredoxin subunit [Dehalococcoidia bacterium]
MAFEKVTTTSEVPEGEVRVFSAGGRSIALAHVAGSGFYAIDNLCTHDGGPLGEGTLVAGTVECPRHGARFDVKTGAVRALPAVRPVKAYPVQVEGDEVSVDVG